MPENAGRNLGHRFQKGQSGNPAGKPKGLRHKTTLMAEKLMLDDAKRIVNAVITAACNGDMTTAKIILDRICLPRRSRPFHLPAIERNEDSMAAKQAVMVAVADGDLSPGDAFDVFRMIDNAAWELPASNEDDAVEKAIEARLRLADAEIAEMDAEDVPYQALSPSPFNGDCMAGPSSHANASAGRMCGLFRFIPEDEGKNAER